MATTTYSTKLRLAIPTTGELADTWGNLINTGLTALVDDAIAGIATVSHPDTASYTLTANNAASDEARCAVLKITGALTAARNVVCPTQPKLYIMENATTGGFAVTLKTSAGTGVSVPNGTSAMLRCDGTNVVAWIPVTGTGSAVYATSPTLVTPALGTPSAVVLTNATGTAASLTAGVANGLKSATTTVAVSAATAPTTGQVLTATSSTAAAWQTASSGPATGLLSATTTVAVSAATAPTSGQVLMATSGVAASWQAVTATGLASATTTVAVSAATAPTVGQVLTATSSTAATWQTASASTTATGLASATTTVAVSAATAPTVGQVLTATSSTAATWQTAPTFPAGTVMLFAQTAAPTGWTKSVAHNDKALRVVSGTASSGGSTAFTTVFASRTPAGTVTVGDTTLTTAQIPAHTHTIPGNGIGAVQTGSGNYGFNGISGNTGSEGGGGSHTHSGSLSGTAMDFAVQYVDVIIATKDA